MTFKDLQTLVQSQSGPEQSQPLQRLRDKPFWIWDQTRHKEKDRANKGDCCFNHIIGLPRKDGIEKSIFDYEKLLYDSLLIPAALEFVFGKSEEKVVKKDMTEKIVEPGQTGTNLIIPETQ